MLYGVSIILADAFTAVIFLRVLVLSSYQISNSVFTPCSIEFFCLNISIILYYFVYDYQEGVNTMNAQRKEHQI